MVIADSSQLWGAKVARGTQRESDYSENQD